MLNKDLKVSVISNNLSRNLSKSTPFQDYRISAGASHLEFSGRGCLGVAVGNTVDVYRDCVRKTVDYPYLRHRVFKRVTDLHFAPFEDVVGIGHEAGFASILVPGKIAITRLLWVSCLER